MLYTLLGNTDISVSKVCLGCMSFGVRGLMHDWTLDENESEKIIRHALESGINFFDTANGYSAGTSEEFLGRILKRATTRDLQGVFQPRQTLAPSHSSGNRRHAQAPRHRLS